MIKNVEARNILQGLFDKWNGKSEEVINEAKAEDVPSIIMVEQPLFQLRWYEDKANNRIRAYFGGNYICSTVPSKRYAVEKDFNKHKINGYSTHKIQKILRKKYNKIQVRSSDKRGKKGKGKGCYTTDKFSFIRESNSRCLFRYRFDKKLEDVCRCGINEKEQIVKDVEDLLNEDYTKTQIKYLLKGKYTSNMKNKGEKQQKVEEEKDPKPLEWSDKGELLFNGLHTGLLPSNVAMIQTLHANHSNPFIFADYVCQNLPEARPSVINYICMNYDEIPFNDLINEGMEIMDKQRGF